MTSPLAVPHPSARSLLSLTGALGAGWLTRRLLALFMVLLAPVEPGGTPPWIAVLGGGGGRRVEAGAALAGRLGGVELVVVGTPHEVKAAEARLAGRTTGPVRYLAIAPGTTYACMGAVVERLGSDGWIVTGGYHAPRTRLTWALHDLSRPPVVVTTEEGPLNLVELVKFAFYLVRY